MNFCALGDSGINTAPMTETKPAPAPKKLFIKTYGCQMNVYDSDRMADAMAPHGYSAASTKSAKRAGRAAKSC